MLLANFFPIGKQLHLIRLNPGWRPYFARHSNRFAKPSGNIADPETAIDSQRSEQPQADENAAAPQVFTHFRHVYPRGIMVISHDISAALPDNKPAHVMRVTRG